MLLLGYKKKVAGQISNCYQISYFCLKIGVHISFDVFKTAYYFTWIFDLLLVQSVPLPTLSCAFICFISFMICKYHKMINQNKTELDEEKKVIKRARMRKKREKKEKTQL